MMKKLDWFDTQKMIVEEPWSGGNSQILLFNKFGEPYTIITDDDLHFRVTINENAYMVTIHQIKDVFFYQVRIFHYLLDQSHSVPCPFCNRIIDLCSQGSTCPELFTHADKFISHFKNKSSYRLRFFSQGIHEILSPDEAFKKLDFNYNKEKGEWAWR